MVPDGNFSQKNGCKGLNSNIANFILTFSYLCKSMDRKLRKQIASLILAFSLVLPMAVGLSHAMHEHDQVVCLAENESHIHGQDIDCDHEHYFNPGAVVAHETTLEKPVSLVDPLQNWGDPCAKTSNYLANLSLRGPPMINV